MASSGTSERTTVTLCVLLESDDLCVSVGGLRDGLASGPIAMRAQERHAKAPALNREDGFVKGAGDVLIEQPVPVLQAQFIRVRQVHRRATEPTPFAGLRRERIP